MAAEDMEAVRLDVVTRCVFCLTWTYYRHYGDAPDDERCPRCGVDLEGIYEYDPAHAQHHAAFARAARGADDPPLTYDQFCARVESFAARMGAAGHQSVQVLRELSRHRFGRAPDVADRERLDGGSDDVVGS